MQRVLSNLIENVIGHTPADGSMVIRAERWPTGIEIEVADAGDGIDAAERELVSAALNRGGATYRAPATVRGLGWLCHGGSSRLMAVRAGLADPPRPERARLQPLSRRATTG